MELPLTAISFIFLLNIGKKRGPFIFMFLFLVSLGAVGMITGQPYGENSLKFIGYVFFWPVALGNYLWPYLEPFIQPFLEKLA